MSAYQETHRKLLPHLPLRPTERAKSPEILGYKFVVVTDLEGPLLLGDTALKSMSTYVRPEQANPQIDYGAVLFGETYNWFMENFYNKNLGQEGSDIVLTLPALLAMGVTDNNLLREARTSRRTPGSKEYIDFLRSRGALVIGVTTAWSAPHREIVKDLGLDGMVGTDFSLDDARQKLIESGQLETEMQLTGKFLSDCFQIITNRETAQDNAEKDQLTQALKEKIGRFFVEEIGVTWNSDGKMVPASPRDGYKTKLAEIMTSYRVVGDREKAKIAKALFEKYAPSGIPRIAIGDGFNDIRMLDCFSWSIGLNGAKAAGAAKIGVITNNVQIIGELIKLIQQYPEPTKENVRKVVKIARSKLGHMGIIHLGGRFGCLSDQLIKWHKLAKNIMRQEAALLP
jgi:predicted HAD superfamily phosphohydrolase